MSNLLFRMTETYFGEAIEKAGGLENFLSIEENATQFSTQMA
jgi:hypothetical protein